MKEHARLSESAYTDGLKGMDILELAKESQKLKAEFALIARRAALLSLVGRVLRVPGLFERIERLVYADRDLLRRTNLWFVEWKKKSGVLVDQRRIMGVRKEKTHRFASQR